MISIPLMFLLFTFYLITNAKDLIDYSLEECEAERKLKWKSLSVIKRNKIHKDLLLYNLTDYNAIYMGDCANYYEDRYGITLDERNGKNAVKELNCKYILHYFDIIAFERDYNSFTSATIDERSKALGADGFKKLGSSVCKKYILIQRQENA